jgi:uncharacterized protein YbbC (DUF1343 family)
MSDYSHSKPYSLPIKPSPNLPNDLSVRLYPSLCFFEATQVSIGRGTQMPFQVIGYPDSCMGLFSFTPHSIDGMSKKPKHKDEICYGIDLRTIDSVDRFTLKYFISFMNKCVPQELLFDNERWFNLLAGNDSLIRKIKDGWSEEQIKASWKNELSEYDQLRSKYLLYK